MMPATATPMALLRVPRGSPRPGDDRFREALAKDRQRLHLPPPDGTADVVVAGPFPIEVDGRELDEWVAWEQ